MKYLCVLFSDFASRCCRRIALLISFQIRAALRTRSTVYRRKLCVHLHLICMFFWLGFNGSCSNISSKRSRRTNTATHPTRESAFSAKKKKTVLKNSPVRVLIISSQVGAVSRDVRCCCYYGTVLHRCRLAESFRYDGRVVVSDAVDVDRRRWIGRRHEARHDRTVSERQHRGKCRF